MLQEQKRGDGRRKDIEVAEIYKRIILESDKPLEN
jgi:hypothetical protein